MGFHLYYLLQHVLTGRLAHPRTCTAHVHNIGKNTPGDKSSSNSSTIIVAIMVVIVVIALAAVGVVLYIKRNQTPRTEDSEEREQKSFDNPMYVITTYALMRSKGFGL